MQIKKICHFTSAHQSSDVRIFIKECTTLAEAGYDTYLVAKGESREQNGVHVIGVGTMPENRIKRMAGFSRTVYKAALSLDCDIYHFHDPELLPYGLKLKKKGKKVIFDSHEDVPGQIQDKRWIPKPLRKLVSRCYRAYETHVVKQLDAVVAATPHIAEKFAGRAKKVVVVNNFPRLDDIVFHETPFSEREPVVCYAGGIDELRGEKIMLAAMQDMDGELIIAGDHKKMVVVGVRYIGRLDRNGVNALYGRAVAGLCLLKPIENYYYSRPIKMYEYMAAGLPFVCSDFPLWRAVAEESGAGICVNPADIGGIRSAIEGLLQDRLRAQEMGQKGRAYVLQRYNWANEARALLALYETV